jgi:predicted transcriptional regulator
MLMTLRGRGLTHSKIAKAVGVSETLVSMWFTGKRKASEEHMIKLRNLDYWTSSDQSLQEFLSFSNT